MLIMSDIHALSSLPDGKCYDDYLKRLRFEAGKCPQERCEDPESIWTARSRAWSSYEVDKAGGVRVPPTRATDESVEQPESVSARSSDRYPPPQTGRYAPNQRDLFPQADTTLPRVGNLNNSLPQPDYSAGRETRARHEHPESLQLETRPPSYEEALRTSDAPSRRSPGSNVPTMSRIQQPQCAPRPGNVRPQSAQSTGYQINPNDEATQGSSSTRRLNTHTDGPVTPSLGHLLGIPESAVERKKLLDAGTYCNCQSVFDIDATFCFERRADTV